jgi:formylglycine-generating enzyme required for sulfatase activity
MKRIEYFLITVCLALAGLFLTACPNTASSGITSTPTPTPTPTLAPTPVPADLSSLTVSAGTLSPSFTYGVIAYVVRVPNATTSITVTGKAVASGATLSANNGVAQSLNEGANIITIRVTAADGTTTKDYVVTVNRLSFALNMINVPAGTFQRDGTFSNTSTVSAFRMSQNEITRAQFLTIMGTDPSNAACSSGTSDPVQTANWYHAIAFCNKLSLAEALTPVYAVSGISDWAALDYDSIPDTDNATWNAATAAWDNEGYRLPTEMEWMWAAMGAPADGQDGGTNSTGYLKAFAGSTGFNAIGDYSVYGYGSGETGATTTQRSNTVGSKEHNELDLYDMSGNVSEWIWDWKEAYPEGPVTDYRGAASGTGRAVRGGAWLNNASNATVAHRIYGCPFNQIVSDGFRVTRR